MTEVYNQFKYFIFGRKNVSLKENFAFNYLIIPFSLLSLLIIAIQIISGINPIYWLAGSLWVLLLMGGFRVMADLKWLPHTPDEKEFRQHKFCEQFEEHSRIVQPINTWTNLGFVVSGLMIILIAGHHQALNPQSPMSDPRSLVPLFYAIVVIFLGPGSMLFHASGKKWAGWFDTFSMVAWVGYSFSYTGTRILITNFGAPPETLAIAAILIVGGIGVFSAYQGLRAYRAKEEREEDGLAIIKVLGGLWLLTELITMILIWTGHPPGFRRSTSWLIAAIIAYIAAFICWIPSTGELKLIPKIIPGIEQLWCNPESPYQGHGFWHLFAALGSLCIYLHYASETPV